MRSTATALAHLETSAQPPSEVRLKVVPASAPEPENLEVVTECNLCGGRDFDTYVTKRGVVHQCEFPIVTCADCGLLFVTPRLSEKANKELYDEAYFCGKGFDSSMDYVALEAEDDTIRAGENRGVVEKIRLLRPGLDARVLDVGCGTGGLLRAFDASGYRDVWGIELSEYSAKVAQSKSRARVLVGDFVGADFGDVKFDAINATEVIEHARDPMAFFRKVKNLLKPGGVFLYTTGNAAGMYARVLGRRWPYLVPEGHLVYFKPSTITRYFESVGLGVLGDSELGAETRASLHRCDDLIIASQLAYVGQSDHGAKGRVFRLAKALTGRSLRHLVTLVVGKSALPVGINRA